MTNDELTKYRDDKADYYVDETLAGNEIDEQQCWDGFVAGFDCSTEYWKEKVEKLEAEISRLNDKYDFQLIVRRNDRLEEDLIGWKHDCHARDVKIEKLEADNKVMREALTAIKESFHIPCSECDGGEFKYYIAKEALEKINNKEK